jgi:5'-nucleotidase (lipoprotein e(P4) family)
MTRMLFAALCCAGLIASSGTFGNAAAQEAPATPAASEAPAATEPASSSSGSTAPVASPFPPPQPSEQAPAGTETPAAAPDRGPPAAQGEPAQDELYTAPAVGLELLNATAWYQTAVEYRAITLQSFELARRNLDRALANPRWTAAIEQDGDFTTLPPAIILDVDETVLDNAPYQVRLVLEGREHSSDAFFEWVLEARALPVPGAVEFTQYADERGVAVFYVTNRDEREEAATVKNLQQHGFPVRDGAESVLTRGESGWSSSDKTARRQAIAQRYRILLLVGDDFNDFIPARGSLQERAALFETYRNWWGQRWIMLPNPMYGSWHGALIDYQYGQTYPARLNKTIDRLDPQQPRP